MADAPPPRPSVTVSHARFLYNNALNGTIPKDIGVLTNLMYLCVCVFA